MSDANKAVVLELYRRHNAGDFDVFDELMSDDFVEHERFWGRAHQAGVRHLFEMIHAAFEKATFEVHDVIAEGDKVSVLARLDRDSPRGVHAGGRLRPPDRCGRATAASRGRQGGRALVSWTRVR